MTTVDQEAAAVDLRAFELMKADSSLKEHEALAQAIGEVRKAEVNQGVPEGNSPTAPAVEREGPPLGRADLAAVNRALSALEGVTDERVKPIYWRLFSLSSPSEDPGKTEVTKTEQRAVEIRKLDPSVPQHKAIEQAIREQRRAA